jgi:hypothetical protein
MARSIREVFEDHLRLRVMRDLEDDLGRNHAGDVVLLTARLCSNPCTTDWELWLGR